MANNEKHDSRRISGIHGGRRMRFVIYDREMKEYLSLAELMYILDVEEINVEAIK